MPQYSSVFHALHAHADEAPHAVALSAPGQAAVCYGELLSRVDTLARNIAAPGHRRGRAIGTLTPNGPDAAIAILGAMRAGACAPLNPGLSDAEARALITQMGIDLIVTVPGWSAPALDAARAIGVTILELRHDAADVSLAAPLARPRRDDVALLLGTSGTTARPKIVPLTHANVYASTDNIARWLLLGPSDRCLNVLPLFHVHGLVSSVLATLITGGDVVCTPGFDAGTFFDTFGTWQPTWFSAVPTIHQAILERARRVPSDAITNRSTRLRFIRSASAALPIAVAEEVETLFGVPLIEVYGMTEAAGQICSSPMPPGRRRAGTVGIAAGPEVAVLDERGQPVPVGTSGEIAIRGANVIAGYADPSDNVDAFVGDWLRSGDRGVLQADGCISVTGRIKETINRGGETISPQEIDAVLLSHPQVAAAVTFAVPDQRLGEQVAAAVVLRGPVDLHALRHFVADHLSSTKVPRRIVVLDALPLTATGKVQRIGLAERLGLSELDDTATSTGVAERNSGTLDRLAGFWRDVLNVAHVHPDDRFLELGGDSLSALRLIALVNDAMGIRVSLLELFDCPTLSEQAALLDAAIGAAHVPAAPPAPKTLEALADVEPVEQIVRRLRAEQPDRRAIDDGELSWSYAQLDEHIDAIAAEFLRRGVAAQTLVGVAMPQSAWLVAAVLALHRIGAAYVHLDASLPKARRAFIIDDAQLRFVVCHGGLEAVEGAGAGAELVDIAALATRTGVRTRALDVARDATSDPERAAYVIYTSGSTGTPKGVVVGHAALAAFVHAVASRYGITGSDRVLQFHSPSFDASVEEIFVTLAVGATLVIRGDDTLGSTRWFLDDVAAKAITILNLPTSLWHAMVRDLGTERTVMPTSVRAVIFGGEAANATLVSTWTRVVGTHPRLFNAYGPTEATVDAVVHELTGLSFAADAPVPIGRPLDGVSVHVLDADGRAVGRGELGELHLGGRTLATGYLRRPEITAERFITLPSISSERLYRTGDRVSVTDDGLIVFHGRLDDQVKVRGHRVELSEVEALIGALPGIASAAVLAHRRADTMTLVAHVVASDPSWGSSDVLDAARPVLPEYFMPSTVVMHTSLPRTTGGKVDRAALRATQVVAVPVAPSPYQLAVWLDHQMNPDDAASNLMLGWQLTGALDVEALDRALTCVITRHDALRSRIELRGGSPSLVIDEPSTYAFETTEGIAGAVMSHELARQTVANAASAPFDLSRGLPWRAVRVCVDIDATYIAMVFHHSVVDGLSLAVIERDLANAYAANVQGTADAVAPLPLAYRDALRGIETRSASPRHADDLRWWVERLTGAPSHSSFVSAHPSLSADARNEVIITRADTTAETWAAMARTMNTTPFVVGLSLVVATLRQLGGDDELTLSTPVADRERPGSEQLVGMFVNLTVLRTRVGHDETFRDLIVRMRRDVAESMDRRGVAFPDLVRQLRPARVARRNPLCDVSFQMMLPPRPPLMLPGLEASALHTDYKPSREGLEVQTAIVDGVVTIACRRNPEVLDYAAMESFAQQLWENAAILLANPDALLPAPQVSKQVRRAALRHTPAPNPCVERVATAGATALVDTIVGLLRNVLEVDAVGPHDNFFELGGHSLLAIRLLSELEGISGVPLPLGTLLEHPTAAALASVLSAPTVSDRSRLLVPLDTPDLTAPVLYCLHPAGGGVYMYEQLHRHLAPRARVVGIVERGFDGTGPTSADCAAMARDYLAEIAASGAPLPELLAGYSSGGFLAYEMACQLADAGHPPKLVVLFDAQYGEGSPRGPLTRLRQGVAQLRRDGLGGFVNRLRAHRAWLAEQQRNERLWHDAVRQGVPVDAGVAETMSFRRNIAMIDTFPARRFAGHVLFIRSNGEGMKDAILHRQSPEYWSRLCAGEFDVVDVSGEHNSGPRSMFVEPYVEELTAAIQPLLRRYRGRDSVTERPSRSRPLRPTPTSRRTPVRGRTVATRASS